MDTRDILYQGNVNIYLEGQRALLPITHLEESDNMAYFIGSDNTRLLVRDFRKTPNDVAKQVLSGDNSVEFADVFNQAAWLEVQEQNGNVEFNIHESYDKGDFPILWLGVIRAGKMPVHNIAWEVLRPLDDEASVAFAVLVQNN